MKASTLSLERINNGILKIQELAFGIGDTIIVKSGSEEKLKVTSNELVFEEDHVYMYLTYNPNVQKLKCVFTVTEIDEDFVISLITKVGLRPTEENIQNYGRDPSLVEKFWNDEFQIKYNEIMKYLRKSKISYQFYEKFKPAYKKDINGEPLHYET